MSDRHVSGEAQVSDGALVTRAVLRAADRLGLTRAELAKVLGIGTASVSRMAAGRQELDPGGQAKAYEIALHLIRLYRSLDALAGEEPGYAAWWLRQPNRWLGEVPADAIRSVRGLIATVDHLDAFRARV
ncbi:antitoxin Xre-like helix-turn-helix domain-containing protein [Rhodocista pekingensis]|uniref:Antitoxin Xre-like helix-turn-helix domain-containing protein n=1 Tax=Rhodocista pekingensis TaxID=201185 RepID=A0ABW2KY14_9PROT